MAYFKVFVAGFLSVLVFHQGLLWLFYIAGISPRPPFNTAPVPPLGVPQFVSSAFFGGVWALVLWPFLRRFSGSKYWLSWLAVGAVAPSAVALFLVFPLKGMPMAGGWDPKTILGALLVNGAWGIGTAALIRLFRLK